MADRKYKVGDRVYITRAHDWKPQGPAVVTEVRDDGAGRATVFVKLDTGEEYFIGVDQEGRATNRPDFDIS